MGQIKPDFSHQSEACINHITFATSSPYTIFIDNFRGKGCWGKQQRVAAEVRSKIHITVGNAETWTMYGMGPSKVNQKGQLNPSASKFSVNTWKPRYFSIVFCKSIERTVQFSKLLRGQSAHVKCQSLPKQFTLGVLNAFLVCPPCLDFSPVLSPTLLGCCVRLLVHLLWLFSSPI